MYGEEMIAFVLILLLVLGLLILGPFLTISALNVLGISIPLTLNTWLAVFWFHLIIGGSTYRSNNS